MKILRIDPVGGAAGNMILGALIDLGVPLDDLRTTLAGLVPDPFELIVEQASSHGLNGLRLTVQADDPVAQDHDQHARHLQDIEELIRNAELPPPVQDRAIEVFTRIAQAEAAVHNMTLETVHFHEVGALDSIIDIVGNCLALHWLKVDAVCVAPLPIGCGTMECAHGTYPIPVPATSELLRNFPVRQTDEESELVTPTGAALLTAWHSAKASNAAGRLLNSGLGFGHRTLQSRPNILRAMLLETGEETPSETCCVMECNLDDMTPELVGLLTEKLLESGALDAFTTPIQMKKQRPGFLLTVLCSPDDRDTLGRIVFENSSTFGLRHYSAERTVLQRSWETVETRFGPLRIKVGRLGGQTTVRSPEIEDCRKAAETHGVPVKEVYEAAVQADAR